MCGSIVKRSFLVLKFVYSTLETIIKQLNLCSIDMYQKLKSEEEAKVFNKIIEKIAQICKCWME